jgi:inner membrane protein
MYRAGHYGAALIAASPLAFALTYFHQPFVAVASVITMLALTRIPDWDMWLPGVSHRGITHTIVFTIFIGGLMAVTFPALLYVFRSPLMSYLPVTLEPATYVSAAGLGFLTGALAILAHLAADIITPRGIHPFLPHDSTRYTLDLVPARSPSGNALLQLVGLVCIVVAFGAGLHFGGVTGTELVDMVVPDTLPSELPFPGV